MKTIGLISGMSWESSSTYYSLINRKVREKLGGFHSAKLILLSVDFSGIEGLQRKNDWEKLNTIMLKAAQKLEKYKVDLIVLCTNTMHLFSEEIRKNISIPFIHIAEETASEILRSKITKVGLLGTKFTMEKIFYKKVLMDFGIDVIIPNKADREIIHRIIYTELVHGKFLKKSKEEYKRIIKNMETKGLSYISKII